MDAIRRSLSGYIRIPGGAGTAADAAGAETPRANGLLERLAGITAENSAETVVAVREVVLGLEGIEETLQQFRETHAERILDLGDGVDWITRTRDGAGGEAAAAAVDLKQLAQFRKTTCDTFQELANRALHELGVAQDIKWTQYGTDAVQSDIDLIAMPRRGLHTAGELYLASSMMDLFAEHVFGEGANTEHLFDWATYVGHHANIVSRGDFQDAEAFDAFNLQLAFQQIQRNASPKEWDGFREAIFETGAAVRPRLVAALMNVEQFRDAQQQRLLEFVHRARGNDDTPRDLEAAVRDVQPRERHAFQLMVNAGAMARCDQLEGQIRRVTKGGDVRQADELRLQWLAAYAIVESEQEGGQYSPGAYHVICKDHGSQRHGKHEKKVDGDYADRIAAATAKTPFLDVHALNKHHKSNPRDFLTSTVENFGFFLHQKDRIGGSKYMERTLAAALEIAKSVDGYYEPTAEIAELHEHSHELLAAKRKTSIADAQMIDFFVSKLPSHAEAAVHLVVKLRDLKDELGAIPDDLKRIAMDSYVRRVDRKLLADPAVEAQLDGYFKPLDSTPETEREATAAREASYRRTADADAGNSMDATKQQMQDIVIQLLKAALPDADLASQSEARPLMLDALDAIIRRRD